MTSASFSAVLAQASREEYTRNHENGNKKWQISFAQTPGVGGDIAKQYHYSQISRVGPFVFPAGQGPVDSAGNIPKGMKAQVNQSMANLDIVLAYSGITWDDVYFVRSFTKGNITEALLEISDQLRTRSNKSFARTMVGVTELTGGPEMLVEIEISGFKA